MVSRARRIRLRNVLNRSSAAFLAVYFLAFQVIGAPMHLAQAHACLPAEAKAGISATGHGHAHYHGHKPGHTHAHDAQNDDETPDHGHHHEADDHHWFGLPTHSLSKPLGDICALPARAPFALFAATADALTHAPLAPMAPTPPPRAAAPRAPPLS